MNLFYLIGVFYMDYDEKLFKAKANIKAQRIWLVFALLLTANYGSDVSSGLYPVNNYIIFVILCWIPFFIGEILLRIKGKDTDLYINMKNSAFRHIHIFSAFFIHFYYVLLNHQSLLLTYFLLQAFLFYTSSVNSWFTVE